MSSFSSVENVEGGLRPTNDFVIDVETRLNNALGNDTNCKFIGL